MKPVSFLGVLVLGGSVLAASLSMAQPLPEESSASVSQPSAVCGQTLFDQRATRITIPERTTTSCWDFVRGDVFLRRGPAPSLWREGQVDHGQSLSLALGSGSHDLDVGDGSHRVFVYEMSATRARTGRGRSDWVLGLSPQLEMSDPVQNPERRVRDRQFVDLSFGGGEHTVRAGDVVSWPPIGRMPLSVRLEDRAASVISSDLACDPVSVSERSVVEISAMSGSRWTGRFRGCDVVFRGDSVLSWDSHQVGGRVVVDVLPHRDRLVHWVQSVRSGEGLLASFLGLRSGSSVIYEGSGRVSFHLDASLSGSDPLVDVRTDQDIEVTLQGGLGVPDMTLASDVSVRWTSLSPVERGRYVLSSPHVVLRVPLNSRVFDLVRFVEAGTSLPRPSVETVSGDRVDRVWETSRPDMENPLDSVLDHFSDVGFWPMMDTPMRVMYAMGLTAYERRDWAALLSVYEQGSDDERSDETVVPLEPVDDEAVEGTREDFALSETLRGVRWELMLRDVDACREVVFTGSALSVPEVLPCRPGQSVVFEEGFLPDRMIIRRDVGDIDVSLNTPGGVALTALRFVSF